jgi:hypothetical protein
VNAIFIIIEQALSNKEAQSKLLFAGVVKDQLDAKAIMDGVEMLVISMYKKKGKKLLNKTDGNNWRNVPLEAKRKSFFRKL